MTRRFVCPVEGQRGPIYYHLISALIGFVPWSVFLGPVAIHTWRAARPGLSIHQATADAHRFLACWIVVYFALFSVSATKLPNYILPLYPAAALLTASFLDAWRRGAFEPAHWLWRGSFQCLFLIGVSAGIGLLIASGAVDTPLLRGHQLPGLETVALVGLIPVIGATVGWWFARRHQRTAVLTTVIGSAILFIGMLAAWGGTVLDEHKAPRSLVRAVLPTGGAQEIRVGCYEYFQPSLVFYCRREVIRFADDNQVLEFLQSPWPVFLFVPEPVWRVLEAKADAPHRLLGRHWDLYRRCEVVVVTNR